MRRRLLPLAVVIAVTCAVTLGSSTSAADDGCPFQQGPRNGSVQIRPAGEVVTGFELGLGMNFDDTNGDGLDVDSIRFHVTGPDGGSKDIPADRYNSAFYTPQAAGTYSVTATWTYFPCQGTAETASGSTPPATVNVTAGERATGGTFEFVRVKRQNVYAGRRIIPGSAHLLIGVKCPPKQIAGHEPIRIDIWWTTSGRPATHASRNVWGRRAEGCAFSSKYTHSKGYDSKTINATVNGSPSLVVREPAHVDALIEIHSGSVLIASKRATFRPNRTGEGATLKSVI